MITYVTLVVILVVVLIIVALLVIAHHKNWISANTRDGISWACGIVAVLLAIGTFLLDSYHDRLVSQYKENGQLEISQLQSASTSRQSAVTLVEPFIVKTALELMYGSNVTISTDEKSDQWYAQWTVTPKQAKDYFNDDSVYYVNSRVFMALPFYANDTDNYLVLTSSLPDSDNSLGDFWQCHACAPVIGGAILTAKNGAWVLTAKTLDIGNIGEWGRTEQGNLIVIGRDHYAVIFQFTYMAQGDIDKTMVIVGPVGNQLKVLLDIPVAGNDTNGTCAMEEEDAKSKHKKMNYSEWCYAYVSKYYFVLDKKSSYYDLVISYAGTDYDESGSNIATKDVSRIDIYRFNGEQYKLAKSIKQPPIDPLSFDELLY